MLWLRKPREIRAKYFVYGTLVTSQWVVRFVSPTASSNLVLERTCYPSDPLEQKDSPYHSDITSHQQLLKPQQLYKLVSLFLTSFFDKFVANSFLAIVGGRLLAQCRLTVTYRKICLAMKIPLEMRCCQILRFCKF